MQSSGADSAPARDQVAEEAERPRHAELHQVPGAADGELRAAHSVAVCNDRSDANLWDRPDPIQDRIRLDYPISEHDGSRDRLHTGSRVRIERRQSATVMLALRFCARGNAFQVQVEKLRILSREDLD